MKLKSFLLYIRFRVKVLARAFISRISGFFRYAVFGFSNHKRTDYVSAFQNFAEFALIDFVEHGGIEFLPWYPARYPEQVSFFRELWINYAYLKRQRPALLRYREQLSKVAYSSEGIRFSLFNRKPKTGFDSTLYADPNLSQTLQIIDYISDRIEKLDKETHQWIFSHWQDFWT